MQGDDVESNAYAALLATLGWCLVAGGAGSTSIRDVLMPGGQLRPNCRQGRSRPTIIECAGGVLGARALFAALSDFGTPIGLPPGYPVNGSAFIAPEGGFIGFRPVSRSQDPVIDVNVAAVPEITRIHFPTDLVDVEEIT